MKTYRGSRDAYGRLAVTVNDRPLDPKPSQRIRNHSEEFNWSYSGSGPAQLALAILFDVTGSRQLAEEAYQDFKRQFVAGFGDSWELTEAQVREWLSLAQTRAE